MVVMCGNVFSASQSAPAATIVRAEPLGVAWLRIGGVVRMSFIVSLPEMTTDIRLSFTPPGGGGVLYRTVHNVHYSYRGDNIACGCDFDWPLNTTYSSTLGTSHHDNVDTNCGFMTNVGKRPHHLYTLYSVLVVIG